MKYKVLLFIILLISSKSFATTFDSTTKGSYITLSSGNMRADHDGTSSQYWCGARATTGKSSGKWYFEFVVGSGANSQSALFGVANTSANLCSEVDHIGMNVNSWSRGALGPKKYHSGEQGTYGAYPSAGNVIGIALDMDAGKMWIATQNTWIGSPTAGTDPMFTGLSGTLYPAVSLYNNTGSCILHVSSTDCTYTPPTGFYQWDNPPPVYIISTSVGHILKSEELDAGGSAIDYLICNRSTGAIVASGTSDANGDYSEEVADGTTEHDVYILDLTTDPPKAKVIAERVVGALQ